MNLLDLQYSVIITIRLYLLKQFCSTYLNSTKFVFLEAAQDIENSSHRTDYNNFDK
jgi:hypothetical protein